MSADRENAERLVGEVCTRLLGHCDFFPLTISAMVDTVLEFAAIEAESTKIDCTCDSYWAEYKRIDPRCESHYLAVQQSQRAAALREQKTQRQAGGSTA